MNIFIGPRPNSLPGSIFVDCFRVTSRTQGFAAPEVGVIQDLRTVGVPGAFGLGLAGLSGLGAEYRGRAPDGSFLNNVSGEYMVLGINAAMGVELSERLSADAALIYYKLWESAPLWEDVYVNQWAFAVGAQLTRDKLKYRLGYSYNTNPINHSVGGNLDGFPVGQSAVQLFQAASTATISQHRITAGIGRQRFLIPNLDLDLFAGGLLNAHDEFGDSQASVAVYYVGTGLTWRYGDCSRQPQ